MFLLDKLQKMFLQFPATVICSLAQLIKSAQAAGGRGGAIATKGGSNRMIGPHVADPNDDSGSLSVILVVILPVLQMFLFVALIIVVRMCYRKYCLKPSSSFSSSQYRKSSAASSFSASNQNSSKFTTLYNGSLPSQHPVHSITMATAQPRPIGIISPVLAQQPRRSLNNVLVTQADLTIVSPIPKPPEPVQEVNNSNPRGFIPPFQSNHYRVAPSEHPVLLHQSLPSNSSFHPPPQATSTTKSLPIPAAALYEQQKQQKQQQLAQQHLLLQRSNTLNDCDALESLASDDETEDDQPVVVSLEPQAEDTEPEEDDEDEEETTEEVSPSGKTSASSSRPPPSAAALISHTNGQRHQSECIYHHSRSANGSRPTSANSTALLSSSASGGSSWTGRCMQTY